MGKFGEELGVRKVLPAVVSLGRVVEERMKLSL